MTTPDRDRRISEWARRMAEQARIGKQVWNCNGCGKPTCMAGLCAACLERIAECVEKVSK